MNSELKIIFTKAYQLQAQGQFLEAINLYENILVQIPNHVETLHFLGLTYVQLDNVDIALQYLLKALALQSNNVNLLNNLANIYKKKHLYAEAISYYQKAIKLDAKYAQAHNNIATVYSLQNNYQKALLHYISAIKAAPDFSAAHFNLGLLLLKNNQLVAAQKQFNNVLNLNSNHIGAQFYLGILNLENNLLNEAEEFLKKVLAQDSEHIEALINLGVISLKKKEAQLAVSYFSKALAIDNENLDARNNLAAIFMHHDRFENALVHYDFLLKTAPNNVEYLYNCGVAQMALGHLNESIKMFEKVLKIQNNHTASLNNMAAIYLKMEQRETASNYLKRALLINPKDTISRHMLHALTGAKGTTTPEYAENLFDNYALSYEQHMQKQLNYSIPKHIGRIIHELRLLEINKTLELGCGTGLTGVVLREVSQHLTGVDISEKMLSHAKAKNLYDVLIKAELRDFLNTNEDYFNLIVAADVFPYLMELDNIFRAAYECLSSNEGYFIFTTEISKEYPYFLETSARFSHHFDYIQKIAIQSKFYSIKHEKILARLQNQQPLEVMFYVFKVLPLKSISMLTS